MTVQDMHYDLKKKLNKVDSQQYRNLLIPELDWALNEAMEIFIKLVAQPRYKTQMGFETAQRTIDDIRTIVVHESPLPVVSNFVVLPADYWHFLNATVSMTKGVCSSTGRIFVRQHDDNFETSPFDKSSFEWKTINCVFTEDGMRLYTDGTFNLGSIFLSYIRRPEYMHYAQGFNAGTYTLPSGVVLSGSVNCELPDHTHREIVDIAVLILSGELQTNDLQVKQMKLNFNQLN